MNEVFIDVCAIALLLWNAMDQPRALSIRITDILAQDGIIILVVGFARVIQPHFATNFHLLPKIGFGKQDKRTKKESFVHFP